MNSITRSIWIILMLGCPAAALAQAPAGEEPASAVDMGDAAPPCVMTSENLPGDAEQESDAPDTVPCEEQSPEAIAEDELKTTGDDVTAQEEFETGEEISEDYPVPLPSDI